MTETQEQHKQRIEHYKRGNNLLSENRFDEAIAAFDEALALDPGWADCMLAKATALSNKGDQDAAIELGNRIAELAPDDAFVRTSLSIFYQRKGLIEEAESAAAQARMISWKEELKNNPGAPPPKPPGGA